MAATLYDEIDHLIDKLEETEPLEFRVPIQEKLRYIRDHMPSYDFDDVYALWKERMISLGFKDETETTPEECKRWLIDQTESMW